MISALFLVPLLLQSSQLQSVAELNATPKHTLTAQEVITVLADFDVYHRDQQPFFPPAFGVTDFSSHPRSVWIFNGADHQTRIQTVIHELLHIYYRNLGLDPAEDFIDAEESRNYQELFHGEHK